MEKDSSKRKTQFLITEAAICCHMLRVKSTFPNQPKEVAHRASKGTKQRKEVSFPDLKLMNSDVDRMGCAHDTRRLTVVQMKPVQQDRIIGNYVQSSNFVMKPNSNLKLTAPQRRWATILALYVSLGKYGSTEAVTSWMVNEPQGEPGGGN